VLLGRARRNKFVKSIMASELWCISLVHCSYRVGMHCTYSTVSYRINSGLGYTAPYQNHTNTVSTSTPRSPARHTTQPNDHKQAGKRRGNNLKTRLPTIIRIETHQSRHIHLLSPALKSLVPCRRKLLLHTIVYTRMYIPHKGHSNQRRRDYQS
jgi:hypothetical protein